jgi:hypothetical protein
MQYRGQFWPISQNNILKLNDSSRRPTRRRSLILYYKRGFWGYISVVSHFSTALKLFSVVLARRRAFVISWAILKA